MAVCGKLLRQETQEVRDQTECYLAPEFSDIAQMEKEAAKVCVDSLKFHFSRIYELDISIFFVNSKI